MSNKTVYLAGPISGLSYGDSTDWRVHAIEQLQVEGIAGLSPMRSKAYLTSEQAVRDEYDGYVLSTGKGITTRDRWDCQRADVVLVNLYGAQKVSIGTVIELGWADAARRPIVLVLEPGNLHDHAIVREVAGFIVPDLESGLTVVTALLS